MLAYYFDEDAMNQNLIRAMRMRHLEVLSALEAGMIHQSDDEQLAYATRHNSVLYSFNVAHFCQIHSEWLTAGKPHSGILLGHQQRQYSVGAQLHALLRLASQCSTATMQNRLEFLSDWT